MSKIRLNKVNIDGLVLVGTGIVLIYSLGLLLVAHLSGSSLGEWIWDRHQNQFSWYSRPLFLVPACYYAYRQKIWHVVGFMLLLATSLFWFEAPEHVSENVRGYLEWENELFFVNPSRGPLLLLAVTVVFFLFGLFQAFWNRNAWYGLLLINAGTVVKVIVSIWFGEAAGRAAIIPSLSSLAVINFIAFLVWRKFRANPRA